MIEHLVWFLLAYFVILWWHLHIQKRNQGEEPTSGTIQLMSSITHKDGPALLRDYNFLKEFKSAKVIYIDKQQSVDSTQYKITAAGTVHGVTVNGRRSHHNANSKMHGYSVIVDTFTEARVIAETLSRELGILVKYRMDS